MFVWNLLCFSLCSLPLIFLLGATENSLVLSTLYHIFRSLYKSVRSYLSLLLSRLNSFSLQTFLMRCSSIYINLVAFHWVLSSISICLVVGSPDLRQCSRCRLTRAEKGEILRQITLHMSSFSNLILLLLLFLWGFLLSVSFYAAVSWIWFCMHICYDKFSVIES